MDIFKAFTEEIRTIIREEIHKAISEVIKQHASDKWLNKEQLAEYWGVSVSYINKKLNEIPHSSTTPITFLKSEADAWRKGELKKIEVASSSKVSVKNYKSKNFRVGK